MFYNFSNLTASLTKDLVPSKLFRTSDIGAMGWNNGYQTGIDVNTASSTYTTIPLLNVHNMMGDSAHPQLIWD